MELADGAHAGPRELAKGDVRDRADRLRRERVRGAVHLPAPGPEGVAPDAEAAPLRRPAHRTLERVRVRRRERGRRSVRPSGETRRTPVCIIASLLHLPARRAGHEEVAWPVARATSRGARPAVVRVHVLAEAPDESHQRTRRDRVLAEVVLAR